MTVAITERRQDHPAKFTAGIVSVASGMLDDRFAGRSVGVLDPFAGVGGVHDLRRHITVGVEIEPEYASQHEDTIVGDATRLPFRSGSFDAVVTSPAYGNRMADQYLGDPKGSERHTYAVSLGRRLNPGSGACLQWGKAYRDLHRKAAVEMFRVVRPEGLVVINVSDHIRVGVRREVESWWVKMMLSEGFRLWAAVRVGTPRQRFGANGGLRVEGELVVAFERKQTNTSEDIR